MRSENTFGVSFTIRKNKNKRQDHSVVGIIACNNTPEKELTIKGAFDGRHWDQGAGWPKLHTTELKQFATHLEKVKSKLTAIFQDLELKEGILTAENIKNHYLGKGAEEQRVTMLELTKLAYAKYEKELKPGSLKNYGATNGYIERFCAWKYPANDIPLRHLDYNFIDELYTYILNNPIRANDPCNKNGAMKHMERLKKMVKWAGLKGWCKKDVFAEFKIKIKRKETEYLNWEQLQKVENVELIKPITKLVRAIFVFCCYTGMAPIDAQSLKPSQLHRDIEGNIWMTYKRTKSEVPAWVPLLNKAKEILDQYGLEPGATYRETIFAYVSNKIINDHLKVIGLACGFDFELHAYMARHTFGTTVTTQLGVPAEVTQIMMGHEDIESTMIYSRVGNPLIMMYMKRVQQKINAGETVGINGINEEQFMLLLEKIAPQVLEKVFTNEIMPKLMEIVHKNPTAPQVPLSDALGNAV
ncbi:integrase [Chitinophaga terrae (ex Kim and Jung 2007)]|uniref:tyrosine-type recombinase/integrase n=1 Tax=Chitinophaga terrae (ex Kim and Jung 2007) TaxID=408074 RepID=UPI002789DB40|nr:site-specific integrase [Chitinophaga terrae (ex Kim and Jung 2007)]MDQ0107438.1 integrase [Chitinophaga terrae (ex Kim and Jung 2007)]